MKNKYIKYLIVGSILLFAGCKKNFLDTKPNSKIVIPTTLDNLQGLMNYIALPNSQPSLGELSCDDYYLLKNNWLSSSTPIEKNAYIWASDVYEGQILVVDWNQPFANIFYCNVVLDGLTKIIRSPDNQSIYDNIKAQALFIRGFNYANLLETFTKPYDPSTAKSDFGLPLRTTANVDEIMQRSTVEETHNFIIKDLLEAANMILYAEQPKNKGIGSKASINALLSRIYLNRREYDKALEYANVSLSISSKLTDYNTLSTSASDPIPFDNEEILLGSYSTIYTNSLNYLSAPQVFVDNALYDSYNNSDLRKSIYFRVQAPGRINNKAPYSDGRQMFTGLCLDEVYLIKAECLARKGDIANAMNTLNALLLKRWVTNTFVPYQATSKEEALSLILQERRKELIFRGIRWSDLRRLNKEGANITLTRDIEGVNYTLPPNDPRYVFAIPDEEINASGVQQNQR